MADPLELLVLVSLADSLAALKAEGKMTLQRLPAGWRVALGHGPLDGQPIFAQLADALRNVLIEQHIVVGG